MITPPLTPPLTPPDDKLKLAELKRELKLRESVYPKLIQKKKLSRDKARRQFWVLKCIIEDFENKLAKNPNGLVWQCPLCRHDNKTNPKESLVYCQSDNGHGCGSGPFYLQQVSWSQAIDPKINHLARTINCVEYNYQTEINGVDNGK